MNKYTRNKIHKTILKLWKEDTADENEFIEACNEVLDDLPESFDSKKEYTITFKGKITIRTEDIWAAFDDATIIDTSAAAALETLKEEYSKNEIITWAVPSDIEIAVYDDESDSGTW